MLAGLAAFGRFWYRFIVGDDWVIAATVLVTLVVVALLVRVGVQAWWLLPVVVIGVLGVSLRRARRPT
ncbi:MAG: hypothetical protein E6J41_02385 [Chloroflexi bacterium]|nr:MAG: hypothetical protein E6J41_02385 [Chloroflexota bacterium]